VSSDCLLKHDTVAVHLFHQHLVTSLIENINQPLKKIIYFSDGSAAQYKNRKNVLILKIHQDFEVPVEWHFFATSHGKNICNSLGGTLLLAKTFPDSSESTEYSMMSDLKENMQLKNITGFVTCVYDPSWWSGCVLCVDENTNKVKITFLHPYGASPSFTAL
jgi:Flp pilus assembly secretin CpaC